MILNLIFITFTSMVEKAQGMFVELLSLNYVFAFSNFSKMKQKDETWSTQMKNMRRNGSNYNYYLSWSWCWSWCMMLKLTWIEKKKLLHRCTFKTQVIHKLFMYYWKQELFGKVSGAVEKRTTPPRRKYLRFNYNINLNKNKNWGKTGFMYWIPK